MPVNPAAAAVRMTATAAEDGLALEAVLQNRFHQSRRAARRILDARCVFVNGRRIWMARHRVASGDRIEIHGSAPAAAPAPAPAARLARATDSIRILHDDARVLIVDKPAGRLSNGPDSVETALQSRRHEPGLRAAHRLDRETTGCMMIARSDAAFEDAVAWFRAGLVKKTYHAIALGRVPRDLREITLPIDGRPAITRVHLIKANETASYLRLGLETGRTHQIRKHLLEAGYPLAGDKAYGTSRELAPALRAIPRQMLHSEGVSFPSADAGAPPVAIHAPLPRDFEETLALLGLAERRTAPGHKSPGGRRLSK